MTREQVVQHTAVKPSSTTTKLKGILREPSEKTQTDQLQNEIKILKRQVSSLMKAEFPCSTKYLIITDFLVLYELLL